MRLKFYRKNRKWYVSVSHNYERYRVCTGAPESDDLEPLRKRVLKLIDRHGIEGVTKIQTPEERSSSDLYTRLSQQLADIHAGKILTNSGKPFTKMSKYNYGRAVHVVGMYPEKFIISPRTTTPKLMEYLRGLDEYMSKTYSEKTRSGYMNIIMVMIKPICIELGISIPPFKVIKPPEGPVRVMLPEEISEFIKRPYEGDDINMRYAYEVCAIMLVTTLRLSDAMALAPSDIYNGQLSKPNQKTGAVTNLPLPKSITTWIEKNIENTGMVYCMPPNRNVVYKYIKPLIAGYSSVPNPHPHMLRASAITNLLYNDVDERHIKFASGHSAKSTSFERYVGFVDQNYRSEIKNFYEKVGW